MNSTVPVNKLQLHASCVSWRGQGILLSGESGSGKSDLALRLIERGALLVADDRTNIQNADGALLASCPPQIQGMLEVRGVGILQLPYLREVRLRLTLELAKTAERLPAFETFEQFGVKVPSLALDPFQISAPEKVQAMLWRLNDKNSPFCN